MSPSNLPPSELSAGMAGKKIPLVVILGPTAVGKTEISIQLAEKFTGEIVSADSRLFYRGMDIGTAKPGMQERRSVAHHLIDVAAPDEIWSLAVFQTKANEAIHDIYNRHHLPFLVGGTGQFVRAIIEAWKLPPVIPNPQLRDVLTQWAMSIGPVELHRKLAIVDPPAANSIDPTNTRRTIRALEVTLSTGRRFSEQRNKGDHQYEPLLIGLSMARADLYQRIDQRIDAMIKEGFMDEVKRLLAAGYTPELPTMSAIGYGEMVAHIQGKITLEEALNSMKRRTREFVRRQFNWFKESDPSIHWFQVNKDTLKSAESLISDWLLTIGWNDTGQYLHKS